MGIVWENLKAGTSLRLRVCLALVAVVTGLWVMVMAAVGFDLWSSWYVVPGLMWFAVLTWWSMAGGLAQRRITSMPLSFTLPGYRPTLRRLSFIGALAGGLAGVSFFIALESMLLWFMAPVSLARASLTQEDPVSLPISVWGGTFECPILAVQCLGVAVWFVGRMASSLLGRALPLILSGKGRSVAEGAAVMLDGCLMLVLYAGTRSFLTVWPVVFVLSVCAFVFAWIRLGDMTRVAQCHRLILGEAVQKARAGSGKRSSPSVERWFMGMMERHQLRPDRCFLWGGLYHGFGAIPSQWKRGLLLLSIPVLGSFMRGMAGVYGFTMLAFAAARLDIPATSALLLPAGRRERYGATVAVAAGVSLLLALAGLGLTLVSGVAASLMPSIGGNTCAVMSLATTCLPALLAPGLIGFVLLDYAPSRLVAAVGQMALALGLVATVTLNLLLAGGTDTSRFGSIWDLISDSFQDRMSSSRLVLLAVAFVVAWICFLLVLHYVLAKGCLVKPGPSRRRSRGNSGS